MKIYQLKKLLENFPDHYDVLVLEKWDDENYSKPLIDKAVSYDSEDFIVLYFSDEEGVIRG